MKILFIVNLPHNVNIQFTMYQLSFFSELYIQAYRQLEKSVVLTSLCLSSPLLFCSLCPARVGCPTPGP